MALLQTFVFLIVQSMEIEINTIFTGKNVLTH